VTVLAVVLVVQCSDSAGGAGLWRGSMP